jgi:hypothetical protein
MGLSIDQAELIRRALESRILEVWTSFPARVTAYDSATQTADVAPVIRRPLPTEDGGSVAEDLPVIPNVPILFPRGGGDSYAMTWQIQPGDHVLVHVSAVSFAGWRRTGETSDPGDVRSHSLGNAYAIPGAAHNAQSAALAQAQDAAMVLEAPMIKLGAGATDFVALASIVMANLNALKDAIGNTVAVPNDGGAAIITAVAGVSFTDVKASQVKAK